MALLHSCTVFYVLNQHVLWRRFLRLLTSSWRMTLVSMILTPVAVSNTGQWREGAELVFFNEIINVCLAWKFVHVRGLYLFIKYIGLSYNVYWICACDLLITIFSADSFKIQSLWLLKVYLHKIFVQLLLKLCL